jgi:hypothetical protein
VVSPVVASMSFAGLGFLIAGIAVVRRELAAGRRLERLVALGPTLVAASLAAFGAEHLSAAGEISQVVPRWIPGHSIWVYGVGLALLAARVMPDKEPELSPPGRD